MIKIESFRNHHKELRSIVLEIRRELELSAITSKPEIIVQLIRKLFGRFSIHLKLEESVLYPQLETHPNLEIRDAAAKFQREMEQVKSDFESFKKNWYNPQVIISDPENFIIETQRILTNLEIRIEKEETIFYDTIESFQET